jgi:hypothetical protein
MVSLHPMGHDERTDQRACMGLGLSGPKRLVHEFSIHSEVGSEPASLSRGGSDRVTCRHNAWPAATRHRVYRCRFDESVIERHDRLSISPRAIICDATALKWPGLGSYQPLFTFTHPPELAGGSISLRLRPKFATRRRAVSRELYAMAKGRETTNDVIRSGRGLG